MYKLRVIAHTHIGSMWRSVVNMHQNVILFSSSSSSIDPHFVAHTHTHIRWMLEGIGLA